MCGIVGIASRSKIDERAWVADGSAALAHRGPDDSGEWWSTDGRVGFGHRRLAIVDISPAGHQPMVSHGGDLCIAFNGEIYNFRALRDELKLRGHTFKSSSDTEVILASYLEWGEQCVERLQGMFAIALYDLRKQRLFLARDRAGEKPLFYRHDGASIRFSSELKALFADKRLPRKLDWRSFDSFLADGFVPAGQSIIQGIRKLSAAHALLFDLGSGELRLWRYWQPPKAPAGHGTTESEAQLAQDLEQLLEEAVRRQLVADVPVGVLLSGGVDSSIVTALAARAVSGVKTFTVRFPGFGAYDETEHARLIARHFGTDHVEVDAELADVGLLPKLARQFDEPMIDSSMVPTYLVSRAVRRHCTVALGGDGGDELFGGYPHYDRMLRFESRLGLLPSSLRLLIGKLAGSFLPPGTRGRNWLQALGADWRSGVPPVTQIFDHVTRRNVMHGNIRWRSTAEQLYATHEVVDDDLLQRATRLDFATYLVEDLLVKVDRASMLNSLEVRAPLLDANILEFAFGRVPSSLKATPTARKILLKKLAQRILPSGFDAVRKQGFSIPLSNWLQSGPWRDYFKEVLLDSDADWYDRSVVGGLLFSERTERSNSERLFGLLMFELWRREYAIEMNS